MGWWEENRQRKKKAWRQLSVGLPLGVALAGGILLSIYSNWYPAGSSMVINSGAIVLLIALLLIVVFVVIFSARHRWEMYEQQYRELKAKKDRTGPNFAAH